jgi:hypothetical protein
MQAESSHRVRVCCLFSRRFFSYLIAYLFAFFDDIEECTYLKKKMLLIFKMAEGMQNGQ